MLYNVCTHAVSSILGAFTLSRDTSCSQPIAAGLTAGADTALFMKSGVDGPTAHASVVDLLFI